MPQANRTEVPSGLRSSASLYLNKLGSIGYEYELGTEESSCWSVFFVFAFNSIVFAQRDIEGSKDHPLLTKMDNFYIDNYQEEKFGQANFRDEKGKKISVEERYIKLTMR